LLAAVPLIGLVWKAGVGGSPEAWSIARLGQQLLASCKGKWQLVAENLLLAGLAGGLASGLALVACWLARESRWFQAAVLILAALAWSLPGPIVGIGLKETINQLMTVEETLGRLLGLTRSPELVRSALYDGPSLLPVLWVTLIRFFPFALAVLWPAVRLLPPELSEAARIDGARPLDELLKITLPLTGFVCGRAALAVAILSLGELSAGKLVETPGWTTLSHVIFEQMHRGVPADVAALCLVLLGNVSVGAALVAWLLRR